MAPIRYSFLKPFKKVTRKEPGMIITRQVMRAQERKQKKEDKKLIRKLQMCDFTYEADDKNMTLSALGPQLVDFARVLGLSEFFREHVHIDKRKSPYSPDKLSSFLILQNIMGYGRIESSRALKQDRILKEKLGIKDYPDPETFRDELLKYNQENIDQLFLVNQNLVDVLCRLMKPQEVDLHFDAKVITVYGDQEGAEVGYNPQKNGRKSYHLKVCTLEPVGLILAIRLEPGDAVSGTDFLDFYRKCMAAVPQNHLVVRTVRLDGGFFSEDNIEAFEGDTVFFDVVAKKYSNIRHWITECIPNEDFEEFYPDGSVMGAAFTFHPDSWESLRNFIVVKKPMVTEKNGQEDLFPKWRYQVICHNHEDMTPKEVWEDYNKRAKIELTIRDLSYDHFVTQVPTGHFFSNFAYFWHCVLSYNLALIFRKYILSEEWQNSRTSTVRKNLINIPGRLVNSSGKMVMRLMAGFPHINVLQSVKERLLWLYRMLHPVPV